MFFLLDLKHVKILTNWIKGIIGVKKKNEEYLVHLFIPWKMHYFDIRRPWTINWLYKNIILTDTPTSYIGSYYTFLSTQINTYT